MNNSKKLFNSLKAELKRNKGLRPKLAVLSYRLGFLSEYGARWKPVRLLLRILYEIMKMFAQILACGDIPSRKVFIDWGLYIPHAFVGTIMTSSVRIGKNATILHGVTLGSITNDKGYQNNIQIGDNVLLGAYSIILGNSKIGNNCNIGAGTMLVNQNVADNITCVNPLEYRMKANNKKQE